MKTLASIVALYLFIIQMTVKLSKDLKHNIISLSKHNNKQATSSSKVVQGSFSPNVTVLVNATKNLIHTKVAFGDWVLDSNPEKPNWIWAIIRDVPTTIGISLNQAAREGLKEVSSSIDL